VVDTSLFETALAWLTNQVTGQLLVRHRTGNPRLVVFQAFETKDGEVVVAAGNDRLFVKLAGVLGHPEWAKDPRFVTNAARVEHRDALLAEIEKIFATRPKGEWIDVLEAEGVPCAPIHTLPEAVAHEQAGALGMIQPVPGDDFSLVGLPLSFDGVRPSIRRAPPGVGQHDAEVAKSATRWPAES